MRKGYIVTWDGLISLSFVLFIMLGFIGLQFSNAKNRGSSNFENLHALGENAVDTLNKQGILEQIGYYWSMGNLSMAANISKDHLDRLLPSNVGYRVEAVEGANITVLFHSGPERPSEDEAKDMTRAYRILSGYSEQAPRSGWLSKAWLSEDLFWSTTEMLNSSEMMGGHESFIYKYAPGASTHNIHYVMIPGGALLTHLQFNLTWVDVVIPTTSTTSTTTSTTTTSTLGDCRDCPPAAGCAIPGNYSSSGDLYNYHYFTTTDVCDINISIYAGVSLPAIPTINPYQIYGNFVTDACQHPVSNPHTASWDCNTFFGDPWALTRTCQVKDLAAGTYYVMVDCWSPLGGILCGDDYSIYVTSGSPGCVSDPEPPLPTAECGNSILESGEQCDDGNGGGNDGCSPSCQFETCTASGLIAYWRFDENGTSSHDYVGSNHGAIGGTPQWNDTGAVGRALYFDGTQKIDISNIDLVGSNFESTNTVSAWFRTSNTDARKTIFYQRQDAGGGEDTYDLIINFTGIQGSIRTEHGSPGGSFIYVGDRGSSYSNNAWHHVAMVKDASNITLYVDGVFKNTNNFTQYSSEIDTNWIGAREADDESFGAYMNGFLDELSLWSRVLTASEIADIYNGGSGKSVCNYGGLSGAVCGADGDCSSDHCAIDYDGSGAWCAPLLQCAHSSISGCDSTCYGYLNGSVAPDCAGVISRYNCTEGAWTEDLCPLCYGGMDRDLPCYGRYNCSVGSPAARCLDTCTKDGVDCDYCGGGPGDIWSDTWYDATCSLGNCTASVEANCTECESCYIDTLYVGSCDPVLGQNPYFSGLVDNIDPFTCSGVTQCDGASACIENPILSCSPKPKAVYFNTGVCSTPQTCWDDGIEAQHPSEDSNRNRTSYREYMDSPVEYYTGGWGNPLFPSERNWFYGQRDDDDISIGNPSHLYVKHGTSVKFEADVATGISSILFGFSAMAEGNCEETLQLYDAAGSTLIGSCTIGDSGCDKNPIDLSQSRWDWCEIDGSASLGSEIDLGENNNFTVKFTPVAGICGFSQPCVMWIDAITITCG